MLCILMTCLCKRVFLLAVCSIPIHIKFTLFYSDRAYSDCARRVSRIYRHAYTIDLPPTTEFLEYTLDYDSDETKLLWNRSDPRSFNGERGKMTTLGWDFTTLTQEDNGFYSLRGKDKTLLDRIMLTVEGNVRDVIGAA